MKFTRIICLLACFASACAQTILPPAQPGDVFLIDPANNKPFLWIHAASGIMEPMSGYKAQEVYRLLLEREQACWTIHQELVDHVRETIAQKPPTLPPSVR